MDNTFSNIFDDNNVEVIHNEVIEEIKPTVITNDDISFKEEKVIENKKKKMDKVLIVQIILLVAWVIITVLVYFFGYDLFSKFIDVSK